MLSGFASGEKKKYRDLMSHFSFFLIRFAYLFIWYFYIVGDPAGHFQGNMVYATCLSWQNEDEHHKVARSSRRPVSADF